jgi:hypothetical protein
VTFTAGIAKQTRALCLFRCGVFWTTARLTGFLSYLHVQQTSSSFLRGVKESRRKLTGKTISAFGVGPLPPFIISATPPFQPQGNIISSSGVGPLPPFITSATPPFQLQGNIISSSGVGPLPPFIITAPRQQNPPKIISFPMTGPIIRFPQAP